MIISLTLVVLAFAWLGYETDWLRVRLLVGDSVASIDYGQLWIDTFVPLCGLSQLQNGLTSHDYAHYHSNPQGYSFRHCLKGKPSVNGTYEILLDPGVDDVLCGKDWLDKHWNDLVDYKPDVYMAIGNVRYTMTIKDTSVIKSIMKANHYSKKEVKALAC